MITFAPYPVPCLVLKEDGTYEESLLLYIQSGEQWNNDIWTCVLKNGGVVRHFLSSQIRIEANATFEITKQE